MSLERGLKWSYKNYDFVGYSLAGISTSLVYSNAKICFDLAQGLPFNFNAKLYCLTHLHADHAAGINYILSQRSLFRLPQANIMLPKESLNGLNLILKEWQKLENFQYDYNLIPCDKTSTFKLDKDHVIKCFQTTHRVSSLGYLVYAKRKRLKNEFKKFLRQEILDLKSRGIEFQEEVLEPIIAFTGDTQIEFLKAHPDILKAKILFMECTYLDNKKSIEDTRKWGHIHLDEITKNLSDFKNEQVCLIHLSARYKTEEALRVLDQKIPVEFREKFSIFPRPF